MTDTTPQSKTADRPAGPPAGALTDTPAEATADAPDGATETIEQLPPIGHMAIIYLGPNAPHWEIHITHGDPNQLDEFRTRVTARLFLLPPHDPQFRRNRERINRDASRSNILLDWDLGFEEEEEESEPRSETRSEPRAEARSEPRG